jgi:hypothetical protein
LAGKNAKSGVLSGGETPHGIGVGHSGKWFENKAMDHVRARVRQEKKHQKLKEIFVDNRSPLSVITELYLDPHSKLGKKIRDTMRDSWQNMGPSLVQAADAWMDAIEDTGELPKQRELAREIGMHEQTVSKGIRKGKGLGEKALLADRRLLDEIDDYLELAGVVGDWGTRGGSLRYAALRLAHRVPAFRQHLVPLLRRHAAITPGDLPRSFHTLIKNNDGRW